MAPFHTDRAVSYSVWSAVIGWPWNSSISMVVASALRWVTGWSWFVPIDCFHRTTLDLGCEVKNLDFKTDRG